MGSQGADEILRAREEAEKRILKMLEEHGSAYTLITTGVVLIYACLALSVAGRLGTAETIGFTAAGSILGGIGGWISIINLKAKENALTKINETWERAIRETKNIIEEMLKGDQKTRDGVLEKIDGLRA
jgi:NADPH:quinone reductase-like Zn-dependent oxidoreductase